MTLHRGGAICAAADHRTGCGGDDPPPQPVSCPAPIGVSISVSAAQPGFVSLVLSCLFRFRLRSASLIDCTRQRTVRASPVSLGTISYIPYARIYLSIIPPAPHIPTCPAYPAQSPFLSRFRRSPLAFSYSHTLRAPPMPYAPCPIYAASTSLK
ncbi:hypothetical protein HYPSUDRAFT_203968 [Hypholoma sublateritium FD-334 SS-4]|uniref:Uncharacterized protein n=1 Tax=Hypholoma sublateritium (strain FD-334 SS-4) TaxID=945553 RepID=A0A0D2NN72_HYPSF|nr:hypothetical protein HYPSUDRAFT_203968 [Hypholoma sublateritium FD-334 SS-4]